MSEEKKQDFKGKIILLNMGFIVPVSYTITPLRTNNDTPVREMVESMLLHHSNDKLYGRYIISQSSLSFTELLTIRLFVGNSRDIKGVLDYQSSVFENNINDWAGESFRLYVKEVIIKRVQYYKGIETFDVEGSINDWLNTKVTYPIINVSTHDDIWANTKSEEAFVGLIGKYVALVDSLDYQKKILNTKRTVCLKLKTGQIADLFLKLKQKKYLQEGIEFTSIAYYITKAFLVPKRGAGGFHKIDYHLAYKYLTDTDKRENIRNKIPVESIPTIE